MKIEVKQEGTLMFLYVDGIAKECITMYRHEDRRDLMQYAADCVRTLWEAENAGRTAARQNPVTLESFAAKIAGPNVYAWVINDGSKALPFAWIPGIEGIPKAAIL